MGERLKVDITRIRESGNALRDISEKFAQADRVVGGRTRDLGSKDLADALHDFAGNWRIHRERLRADLETFAGWALKAADAYEKCDQDLGKVLKRGPE